jgi:hypothetical protein
MRKSFSRVLSWGDLALAPFDSKPLDGGFGALLLANLERCLFPNLSHLPVGDAPFHFTHINVPRL